MFPRVMTVSDFRPKQVLVIKTVSCINSFCLICKNSTTGCCVKCQLERLVLIEDLDKNQVLGQAFVRLIRLEVEKRGYFVNQPQIPQSCCNRHIRLSRDLMTSLLMGYQDMYRGAGIVLLPSRSIPSAEQHQSTVARLRYLVEVVKNSTRSNFHAILIASEQ